MPTLPGHLRPRRRPPTDFTAIDGKDFAKAVARVADALKAEGFGVLTDRERLEWVKSTLVAGVASAAEG